MRKPLLSAPKKLQRTLLIIQKCDINVIYVPDQDMLLADIISKAYLPDINQGDTETELEIVTCLTTCLSLEKD